jgi:enoyl-CoA hydratase/carnithine racemase
VPDFFAAHVDAGYMSDPAGRSRVLEAVLTADAYDARTAELYGWITRAVPAADLDAFVDRIAHRIAARQPGQMRAAKAANDPPTGGDRIDDDLRTEAAALAARPLRHG